jgi:hypothetical protein
MTMTVTTTTATTAGDKQTTGLIWTGVNFNLGWRQPRGRAGDAGRPLFWN